jgi:hypothetical protein
MASKTKKQLKNSLQTSRHKSSATAADATTTNNKVVAIDPNYSNSSLQASQPEIRPKSESYALLGSPPSTPIETFSDVDRFFQHATLSQRGLAWTDIDDPSTEPLSPPKRKDKPTESILNNFKSKTLIQHLHDKQKEYDEDIRSADEDDENTVVTSDQSIKERFIQDTAYLMEQLSASPTSKQSRQSAESSGNTSNTSLSLVELVARVQKLCKFSGKMPISTMRSLLYSNAF